MSIFPWVNETLPQDLCDFYDKLRESYSTEEIEALTTKLTHDEEALARLHHVAYGSEFFAVQVQRDSKILLGLLEHGNLPIGEPELASQLNQAAFDDVHQLDEQLRQLRNQTMCKIIWRDFNRLAHLQETTQSLSWLAEACIQASLDFHYKSLADIHGDPIDAEGNVQPMLILGMGKLGAYELNLSSDIDLIFAFPNSGNTSRADKSIDNQTFFTKVGQRIIKSLDSVQASGFVFRVDMRLRPYGQSGVLVSNFSALEDYYQNQGREWERYAMIKARVVASNGPWEIESELMTMLREFTYRKYVDFSVIEALRKLKQMIVQEVKRRRLGDDIKLGAGGIREIEFIVQAFQLIRGGRDKELQDNRLLVILPRLEDLGCLPPGVAEKLTQAYIFLRNTEHAIQGYQDRQTQKLPIDDKQQTILAKVMGFGDWQTFLDELNRHRDIVSEEFSRVIAAPEEDESHEHDLVWDDIWQNALDQQVCLLEFKKHHYENPQQSAQLIEDLHTSSMKLQPQSKQRLDQFVPLLLSHVSTTDSPSETLERILKLVKSVSRRSAYLILLMENPVALLQLVKLSQASPWIANELAEYPALLDELLDQRTLYRPPSKAELQDELRRTMLRIAEDDLENQMETLRYFRSAHALRVAACEITGALPLMKVSDYLTWIAETILEYVLQLSWKILVAKYGYPDGDERQSPAFIVVGYGKVGGIELGHGSDLDLVFIHNASSNGMTNGDRSIDNQTFYVRLGQKIIHILNTPTASGRLYEVDMRLRPSGNSGLLVSSLASFDRYQKKDAWTWEHQALVRARVVAGDSDLAEEFAQVRNTILETQRDTQTLKHDVITMRKKMREHLGSDKNHTGTREFNIKHDPGGIVDIEFMVQYGVLAWSNTHSNLVTFTDNIRLLERFAQSNLLSAQEADLLTEAYKAYRSTGHKLTLQQQPNLVPPDMYATERQTVISIWNRLLEN